ncbi:NAD-dependent epimerase/dehydratase family protein [Ruegeria arenilitoris]|uniref:NAD-dependent epimerase/dehydratase family protein n=1 Tax=Ruegeria arenilitoris TaxID=1173585 RepID=UPI003C7C2192
MARYLVTGGAGFIGSHLADHLVEAGHDVVVLDNLSTGARFNLPPQVDLIQGDIADFENLPALIARVDGCFHLAAIASVQQYQDGWAKAAKVNFYGSVRVLEAAARANVPVVYASSAAIYGDNPHRPLIETATSHPISGYGADKLAMEHHAEALKAAIGLRATGLRFFNVYGPRQVPGSPYSGVISIFLNRLASGQPITVFGDGEQARDFVYVSDVAGALMRAMSWTAAGNCGVFNICRGEATTLNDLIRVLAGVLQCAPQIRYEEPRTGDIRISLGSSVAAAEMLGFRGNVALEEGLRHTADWVRKSSQ